MAEDSSRYFNEHDDRVSVRKKKGRGEFRFGGDGHKPHSRGLQGRYGDEDGDVAMNDHETPRIRSQPYSVRSSRRRDWSNREGPSHIQVTVKQQQQQQHSDRGSHSRGNNNRKTWFKVVIPFGRKYEKSWLLSSIQSLCSVPFTTTEYHFEGNRVVFYVEDWSTANALKQVSRKILDKDKYKVAIQVNPCVAPPSVTHELRPEDIQHIKNCMGKRYDASQHALDLNSLRNDPDLVSQNIDVMLNRRNYMHSVVKIIEQHIPQLVSLNLGNNKLSRLEDMMDLKAPALKILNLARNEVKFERDLDRIKSFKLEELWLEGNPLCELYRDQSAYVSVIREKFPKLLRLDGHELPPPISFDVEELTTLPQCKGSYFCTDDIKLLVSRFIQQYYTVYDSGDRQGLLNAYHDTACCSLSIPYSPQNPSSLALQRSSLGEYYKHSRNVKKLKDPTLRSRLLKHTRLNVVAFLNDLPKTQHDVASFTLDISTQTHTLLCFSVYGVFKEVDGKSRDSVRAFTRVFVAVPAENAGLCVVNDQLFIRNATTEEIRKAFVTPAPTPSSSPVPTLTAPQQELLQAFSLQSGMNLEWAQKCLQDNDWDFNQAAQVFTTLKSEGKIPDVAFVRPL